MGGKKIVGRSVDGDVLDGVVLTNGVDHVLAFGGLSKNGVLAIEVRSRSVSDEKLGTVGVGACVGHGEDAGLVVATVGFAFALELVAWATGAGALWTTALNHEVRDHSVKLEAIVKPAGGEVKERGYGDGGVIGEGGDVDIALVGVDGDFNVVHEEGDHSEFGRESPD